MENTTLTPGTRMIEGGYGLEMILSSVTAESMAAVKEWALAEVAKGKSPNRRGIHEFQAIRISGIKSAICCGKRLVLEVSQDLHAEWVIELDVEDGWDYFHVGNNPTDEEIAWAFNVIGSN